MDRDSVEPGGTTSRRGRSWRKLLGIVVGIAVGRGASLGSAAATATALLMNDEASD